MAENWPSDYKYNLTFLRRFYEVNFLTFSKDKPVRVQRYANKHYRMILQGIICVEMNESEGQPFCLKMEDNSEFKVDEHFMNYLLNGPRERQGSDEYQFVGGKALYNSNMYRDIETVIDRLYTVGV